MKKYVVIGVIPGEVILPNNEKVDLGKIDDAKAKEILTTWPNFPYLKEVEEKTKKTPDAN